MNRLQSNQRRMASNSPAGGKSRIQETGFRMSVYLRSFSARRMRLVFCILYLFPYAALCLSPADVDSAVAGLQKRYASVETVTGSFRQTFRAPGIDQVESGVFRMKKPCMMRWEYRQPE